MLGKDVFYSFQSLGTQRNNKNVKYIYIYFVNNTLNIFSVILETSLVVRILELDIFVELEYRTTELTI